MCVCVQSKDTLELLLALHAVNLSLSSLLSKLVAMVTSK